MEPCEKRVVARVGFDVGDQGGEEIGVVVVVGFGRKGGEPVKQVCLIYKEEQKVLFSQKKKKRAQHLNVEHRFLEGEVKLDSNFRLNTRSSIAFGWGLVLGAFNDMPTNHQSK